MKIIICGFGSAGYAAAMSAKRADPKNEIVVIDPKENDLMHPCGLPYALEGIINSSDLLQDINLQKGGIKKIKGYVTEIKTPLNEVYYKTDSEELKENYNSIIIASGYRPIIPGFPGLEKVTGKSVFTLTNTCELEKILSILKTTSKCAVIGGGAIGIETAYAMNKKGKSVTLIEMQSQLLNGIIDSDMSLLVEKYLNEQGISVLKDSAVTAFEEADNVHKVICTSGVVESEMTIIAAGFAPDISIAENSGIEFYNTGIKTDSLLRTSVQNVFAAGDCISSWSSIDGKPFYSRLATSAYKQGIIAGINAAGGSTEYRGTSSTFVTRMGNFELAGTGFNTENALKRGFEPVSGRITSKVRPEYYPDNTDLTIKIIFDKNSGMILGAQCAGTEGAASRINLISMAIEYNISIDELWRTEMAYCPSVSEVYDPLLRAADIGLRRFRK